MIFFQSHCSSRCVEIQSLSMVPAILKVLGENCMYSSSPCSFVCSLVMCHRSMSTNTALCHALLAYVIAMNAWHIFGSVLQSRSNVMLLMSILSSKYPWFSLLYFNLFRHPTLSSTMYSDIFSGMLSNACILSSLCWFEVRDLRPSKLTTSGSFQLSTLLSGTTLGSWALFFVVGRPSPPPVDVLLERYCYQSFTREGPISRHLTFIFKALTKGSTLAPNRAH